MKALSKENEDIPFAKRTPALFLILFVLFSISIFPLNYGLSPNLKIVRDVYAENVEDEEAEERLSSFQRKYLDYSRKTAKTSKKISKLFTKDHEIPTYSIHLDEADSASLKRYVELGIVSLDDSCLAYMNMAYPSDSVLDLVSSSIDGEDSLLDDSSESFAMPDEISSYIKWSYGDSDTLTAQVVTDDIVREPSKYVSKVDDIDWKLFYSIMKVYMDDADDENIMKSSVFKDAYSSFIAAYTNDRTSLGSILFDPVVVMKADIEYLGSDSGESMSEDDYDAYIVFMSEYYRAMTIIGKYQSDMRAYEDEYLSDSAYERYMNYYKASGYDVISYEEYEDLSRSGDMIGVPEEPAKPEGYVSMKEILKEDVPEKIEVHVQITYELVDGTDTSSLKERYDKWAEQYFRNIQADLDAINDNSDSDVNLSELESRYDSYTDEDVDDINEISGFAEEKQEYEEVTCAIEEREKIRNEISQSCSSVTQETAAGASMNLDDSVPAINYISSETCILDSMSQNDVDEVLERETSIESFWDSFNRFYEKDYDGSIQKDLKKIKAEIAEEKRVLGIGENIVKTAKTKLGCRYSWGSSGPNTFDCSGFVYWTMKNSGINVGRHTADQYAHMGTEVKSTDDLIPGDIISIGTSNSHYTHIGIYIGDGRVIHAGGGNSSTHGDNPNAKVQITSLSNFIGGYRKAHSMRRLFS